jgi:hypothetical protein
MVLPFGGPEIGRGVAWAGQIAGAGDHAGAQAGGGRFRGLDG